MTALIESPVARKLSFDAELSVCLPEEKSYEDMTPAQKHWFNVIRARSIDKSWSYHGKSWAEIQWELCYLAGYTFLPQKDCGFVHGGINLLRSTGLLVVSHYWRGSKDGPELGISVRLYRAAFDDKTDTIVYGGTEFQNCCYAKDLSYVPFENAHGSIIDPVATPQLFSKALEISEKLQMCAVQPGRKLISSPSFPAALLGFRMDQIPTLEESPALHRAALNYLATPFEEKPVLNRLTISEGGEIASVEELADEWKISIVGQEPIQLPRFVCLNDEVRQGTILNEGDELGRFVWPEEQAALPRTWEEVEQVLGDWAANWLLVAIWDNAMVVHMFGGQELVCIPHTLVSGQSSRAAQKFLDLRNFLGCKYHNPDDFEIDDVVENEADIRVIHLRQAACSEVMNFNSTQDRIKADLWSLPDHWARYFRSGKPPVRPNRARTVNA